MGAQPSKHKSLVTILMTRCHHPPTPSAKSPQTPSVHPPDNPRSASDKQNALHNIRPLYTRTLPNNEQFVANFCSAALFDAGVRMMYGQANQHLTSERTLRPNLNVAIQLLNLILKLYIFIVQKPNLSLFVWKENEYHDINFSRQKQ